MGKFIINLIGDLVSITGNEFIDAILFAVMSGLSLVIAFIVVKIIFDNLGFYNTKLMRIVHWIFRIVIFGVFTTILYFLAKLIYWLLGFHWWVYLIAFILITSLVLTLFLIIYKKRKRKNTETDIEKHENPAATLESNEVPQTTYTLDQNYDRYYCPRCHSRLVKRNGPYGCFYGCSSYGKTGCTYKRKYL